MMSSNFMVYLLSAILLTTSLFMILLVLIQRGRGGGLAGAFGGMGGQSAFGTRAGDIFTKITVVVAVLFILVAALLGQSMRASQRAADTGAASAFDGPAAADLETDDDAEVPGASPLNDDATNPFADAEADDTAADDSSDTPDASTDEPADEVPTDTPADDNTVEETTEPETTEPETTEPETEPAEPEPENESADDATDEDKQGAP